MLSASFECKVLSVCGVLFGFLLFILSCGVVCSAHNVLCVWYGVCGMLCVVCSLLCLMCGLWQVVGGVEFGLFGVCVVC